jgi:hypothetical protein
MEIHSKKAKIRIEFWRRHEWFASVHISGATVSSVRA